MNNRRTAIKLLLIDHVYPLLYFSDAKRRQSRLTHMRSSEYNEYHRGADQPRSATRQTRMDIPYTGQAP